MIAAINERLENREKKISIVTYFSLLNSHSLSNGISYSDIDVNSDDSRLRQDSILTCGIDSREVKEFGSLLSSEYSMLQCIRTTRFLMGRETVLTFGRALLHRLAMRINTMTTKTETNATEMAIGMTFACASSAE